MTKHRYRVTTEDGRSWRVHAPERVDAGAQVEAATGLTAMECVRVRRFSGDDLHLPKSKKEPSS